MKLSFGCAFLFCASALSPDFSECQGFCLGVFLLVRNLRRLLPLSPPRVRGGGFSESWEGKRNASSS